MSVPKVRRQPGPGAPLTAEREQYRRFSVRVTVPLRSGWVLIIGCLAHTVGATLGEE